MIFFTIIFACVAFNRTYAQWKNGIIFSDVYEDTVNYYRQSQGSNAIATTASPPSMLKPECACVPSGWCNTSTGSAVFGPDPRIQNQDAPTKLCSPEFPELCCVQPYEPPPPTAAPTIPTPNPTATASPTPSVIPTTPTPSQYPTPSPTPPPMQPTGNCGLRKIEVTSQPKVGQASFGAYPWQVAFVDLSGQFLTSGALLHPIYILTSAYRISSYQNKEKDIIARLGEWDLSTTTETLGYVAVAVAQVMLHPKYNSTTLENNIAIVRLNADENNLPLDQIKHVNTVCKPLVPHQPGKRCYVSGWGKNLFEPMGEYQKIMREVDVPILDDEDCQNRLRRTRLGPLFVLNRESFMCAGAEPLKDACTGDGGAPLVCEFDGRWYVVGLVAWGIGCGIPGLPGVYTNVFKFMDWINQNIPRT